MYCSSLATSLWGIERRSKLRRGRAATYGFQIRGGERHGMSPNLKVLAAIDLGVLAEQGEHIRLVQTAADAVRAVIEP